MKLPLCANATKNITLKRAVGFSFRLCFSLVYKRSSASPAQMIRTLICLMRSCLVLAHMREAPSSIPSKSRVCMGERGAKSNHFGFEITSVVIFYFKEIRKPLPCAFSPWLAGRSGHLQGEFLLRSCKFIVDLVQNIFPFRTLGQKKKC